MDAGLLGWAKRTTVSEAVERQGIGLWEQGWVVCKGCGHEWVAVRPTGLLALECPRCGVMDADYTDAEAVPRETTSD